jgi:hypothetical protein
LNQVNGAIAYYKSNREAVDAYLAQEEIEFDRMAEESRRQDPEFYAKIEAAMRQGVTRRG